jgi:predicted ATPase/DNA-binding winged helix-turn-helix (wHTH) protein
MPTADPGTIYSSGECEINPAHRELRIRGTVVPIGSRALEIITLLVRSAGELVTKAELMSRIWPNDPVAENTLAVHAAAIRKALGPYRTMLKTEPGRGYRLVGDWFVREQDATHPPDGIQRIMTSGQSPLSNFPAMITPLIGRAAAVARLRDLLSAFRLVSLIGPGGIGKTTLALEVARRIVGDFPDGGWLVELASLSDPALVPSTVGDVLKLGPGPNNVLPETIARGVGHKRLLLILDNCEHLIDAVATLAEMLLVRCPNITILTTSREVPRVLGERVYRVPPLDVPESDLLEPTRLLEHSAPALFVTRAVEFGADLSPGSHQATSIVSICRHLDGIPLAIEFAAARVASLGLDQVAAGLRDRFALLTSGRRTALPRHRTLRATLDWSYHLLTDAEQSLLNRLAIFAGPFTLHDARAVAVPGTSDGDIALGIVDLLAKSLVFRPDWEAETFRLSETTRTYALDRLRESGAHADVAHQHGMYFLDLLAAVDDIRRSAPASEYLPTFRRESDEIHVALEWAFSSGGDAALGLALTTAAVPLWFELFQMPIARARLVQALPHAEPGSDQELQVRVALGHALWYLAPEHDTFEPNFVRVAELAARIGAPAMRARALWGMWASRRRHGDYRAALALARQYADVAREAGEPGTMHLGNRILGLTHHLLGHQALAEEFTAHALREPNHLDPTSGTSYQVETPVAMGAQLARILWLKGFPDQARIAAERAVAAARDGGHQFPVAYAVAFGGLPVALWTGAPDAAQVQVELLLAHSGNDERMTGWGHYFDRVLKMRNGGEPETLIASRADVTVVPPFGAAVPDVGLPVPTPGSDPIDVLWNTAEILRIDAELLLWHAMPDFAARAEAKLLRALSIAREQTALSWELRAATSLARLWRRDGRSGEAGNLLAATYEKFTEGFDTVDLIRARRLLAGLEA